MQVSQHITAADPDSSERVATFLVIKEESKPNFVPKITVVFKKFQENGRAAQPIRSRLVNQWDDVKWSFQKRT